MVFYTKFIRYYGQIAICFGLVTLFSCPLQAQLHNSNIPKVAIIIDDVGHRSTDERLQSLPIEVAFSILPNADYATEQAKIAQQGGREVMIHMPMESLISSQDLGNFPLLLSMPQKELESTIASALVKVPGAVGINNHMGSKFTQLKSTMAAFFESLQSQNRKLFFVDSRTTPFSRAYEQALAHAVPAVERNVFLDHIYNEHAIAKQFARLIKKAKEEGSALAIGHPNRHTLEYLQKHLPNLSDYGVELVSITEYVNLHDINIAAMRKLRRELSPSQTTSPSEIQHTPEL